MLFALCKEFIHSQRTGNKFQKTITISISDNKLKDPEGTIYQLLKQQQDIEAGDAQLYEVQTNQDGEVIFVIKEVNVSGQRITTNIQINLGIHSYNQNKEIYKSIKKKIVKLKHAIQKSGQKKILQINQIQPTEKEDDKALITDISDNEISYIKLLNKLSKGVSKSYIIQYFKNNNIQKERLINLLYKSI